jgi:hypothetical protein
MYGLIDVDPRYYVVGGCKENIGLKDLLRPFVEYI